MKERLPNVGSIAHYIEEVVGYKSKYETGEEIKEGYPPIVAELLLSLLIEVRTFCTFGRLLFGALLFFTLKALLFGL